MRPVSDKLRENLRNNMEKDHCVKNSWGCSRLDFAKALVFPWPYDREKYDDRVERASEFLDSRDEGLIVVAYEDEQYMPYSKNFLEENSDTFKIKASDLPNINEKLNEFILVPEDVEWGLVFDHDGRISFNGDKKFIRGVKEFFPDWRVLTHQENVAGSLKERTAVVNSQLTIHFSEEAKKFRNGLVKTCIGNAYENFEHDFDYELSVQIDVDKHSFLDSLRYGNTQMIVWSKDDVEFKLTDKLDSTKDASLQDQMTLFLGESLYRNTREQSDFTFKTGEINYNWEKVLGLAAGYAAINHERPVFLKNFDREYLEDNREKIMNKLEEEFKLRDQELFTGGINLMYWTGFHIARLIAQRKNRHEILEMTKEDTLNLINDILEK